MESVVVTGASRGIGLELARQYAEDGWRVLASCRDPASAAELRALADAQPHVELIALDVSDAEQIDALAARLASEPLDLLINNAGVYGRKGLPLEGVEAAEWLEVFAVNAIAPFLLTRALRPSLAQAGRSTVAMIGSKVGSIADNGSGGNYAYRTSKAALNQIVRSLSIELFTQGVKVLALHPGWVKTRMGGPNALIEVDESVRGLRRVIADPGVSSGSFHAYDGSEIPW